MATTLQALLGTYPQTRALHDGTVSAPGLAFEFAKVAEANQGFKMMVRETRFDVSELAIMSLLQARAYGKPIVALPAVVFAFSPHRALIQNRRRTALAVADLPGKRIGVRAWAQTTSIIVRDILANEYGVDPASITWVVTDEGHLAEFKDPPQVVRAPPGKSVNRLLEDGDVDAAVTGGVVPDNPDLVPIIAEPENATRAWCRKHGTIPLNHLMVASEALVRRSPETVRTVFDLLKRSEALAPPEAREWPRFGLPALRRTLEFEIAMAAGQGMLPRPLTVDELFDDVTRGLV